MVDLRMGPTVCPLVTNGRNDLRRSGLGIPDEGSEYPRCGLPSSSVTAGLGEFGDDSSPGFTVGMRSSIAGSSTGLSTIIGLAPSLGLNLCFPFPMDAMSAVFPRDSSNGVKIDESLSQLSSVVA